MTVHTFITHRGGPASNLSVVYRAVDADTGLVVDTRTWRFGTVADQREVHVRGTLAVERQGGYRIETVIYEDGKRLRTDRAEGRGVGTLQPADAESAVRFHRFDAVPGLPPVQYRIESVPDTHTTLAVSTYLTNGGDAPRGDLRLVGRPDGPTQTSSPTRPQSTSIPSSWPHEDPDRRTDRADRLQLLPRYRALDERRHRRDGAVGGHLDPTETLEVNTTRREIDLQVGDFESTQDPDRTSGWPRPAESTGTGFGALGAVAALVGALVVRRWTT